MNFPTRYKALLKVHFSAYFSNLFNKTKLRGGNDEEKSKGKKAIGLIVTAFSFIIILLILVSSAISLAYSAIQQNYFSEALYMIVGVSQLSILILGGNVILSSLYFSNDTKLLLSLPIKPIETYAAKFTVAYLSQLIISAFFVPVLIAFGVTATVNGMVIQPVFYIMAVLSFFLLPVFPTFLMGVFSAPIMLLVKLFKNKERAKTLLTILSSALGMALYFVIIFSTSMRGDSGDQFISNETISVMKKVSEFFIYNYNFCEAMLGNNAALNGLAYIAECIGAILLAVLLCGIFYKKIMYIMQDSSATSKRGKQKGETFKSASLTKAMFMKDLRMIVKIPTLLFSSAIGLVLTPIFTVVFHTSFSFGDESSLSASGSILMGLGIIYYLVMMMIASSNSVTGVCISAEKGNFAILKTLPVTGTQIVKSKLFVASILNGAICLSFLIAYLCIIDLPIQILYGFALTVMFFFTGQGLSAWEIMRDLKSPNFRYNNINELTRNNKKLMKPIFTFMGIGLVAMIVGMACGGALPEDKMYIGYILFFAISGLTSGLVYFLPVSSVKKYADKYYHDLEV